MDILHHCEKPFVTSPSPWEAHRTTGWAHSFLLHVDRRCHGSHPKADQKPHPRETGTPYSISVYIVVAAMITVACVLALPDRSRVDIEDAAVYSRAV